MHSRTQTGSHALTGPGSLTPGSRAGFSHRHTRRSHTIGLTDGPFFSPRYSVEPVVQTLRRSADAIMDNHTHRTGWVRLHSGQFVACKEGIDPVSCGLMLFGR